MRHETQGDWAHFFLATYWDSLRAIKAFAGDDYQVAVTYPDDEQLNCSPTLTCSTTTYKTLRRCNRRNRDEMARQRAVINAMHH